MSNQQPRLTGCLRVYSGVTGSNEPYTQQQLREELKLKKQHKQNVSTLTWKQLAELINSSGDPKQGHEAAVQLKDVALGFINDDSNVEALEEAALFLFDVFKDASQITSIESSKLRSTFGPYSASLGTKAFDIVKTLVVLLPEETLTNDITVNNEKKKGYFDKSLKINFSYENIDFDSLYSFDENGVEDDRVDNLLNHVKDNLLSHQDKANVTQNASVNGIEGAGTGFSSSWLLTSCNEHVEKNPGSLPANDLAVMTFEILTSKKSDDDIQNDLFDLLGFEAFDFIQKILENRNKITDVTTNKQAVGFDPSLYQNLNPTLKLDKPLPGSQVIIQTEQEKLLAKKMQKEERKLMKQNPTLYNEIFQKNQDQLDTVRRQPLFQKNITGRIKQYPFVFDEFATRKLSSAYIAGTKILLPEGMKKNDCRQYEEIEIPAAAGKTPNLVTNSLIKINELDEVGQLAFKGMKSLNIIQSVVFETAYETNENLLISAPTGAGKTNIALLTIVHEIKNNIKNGVVKKDAFKIVYVAPMKALAAEMTANFGKKLQSLGILVRELTGDMQLTKREIQETQMLVTTPEKWDVVTRKGSGDIALTQLVKLLIIDEVHLLHDDRGAVLEALVARTLRQVESSQTMIRIVGLSATLPNYVDVARFLNVNPYKGLFYFDGRFRPVPLQQTFIGIRATGYLQQMKDMDEVCYEKVLENVRNGHQVMVFVHARNATVKTALMLREKANNEGDIEHFLCDQNAAYGNMLNKMNRSRNKQLREMFPDGFGIHHAGMLRQDRSFVEELFSKGFVKVLVCTATLAWGVNLPAHAVIIKGTQIYDAKKGAFVHIGILDVMQIFGRAGRPQFDKWGHGTIITKHDKLAHYLQLLTQQTPIESQFVNRLTDNLNAEVSIGSVTNVDEAVQWLSYTYLYVRMRINPLVYGINYKEKEEDPLLEKFRTELIKISARKLDKARMIRFDERTGYLFPTNLGRTASNYYIDFPTIELVNEFFKQFIDHGEIFSIVSKAHEFDQVKVRAEELPELEQQMKEYCQTPIKGGVENEYGKVNILLQTYISKGNVDSFSLVSDTAYVAQNAIRIIRALFEVALQKNWAIMAHRMLTISKIVDRRLWDWEHPFRQFDGVRHEVLNKLESRNLTVEKLREMDSKEIGYILNHVKIGSKIRELAFHFPTVLLASSIQPITRNVLRVRLLIKADFRWNDKIHGTVSEPWWIWVEEPNTNQIYHHEYFMLSKKAVKNRQEQELIFTVPIHEPLPPQYYVRVVSDRWLHAEAVCAISFKHLILPEHHPPHTELLNLQPLPITCLRNSQVEKLYNFTHFNPIQTQLFHTLYYSETNVLLGAPTGSGKTIAAEIAMFGVFREQPKSKVVYIAPLKALVRERITDWKIRLEQKLGKKIVELTGDVTPDMNAITNADVIVTTPEKWDGVSRSWQTRKYVKDVALLVIDEIHLLGDERGPVLEVIISRINFISSHTEKKCRVIGLSTALANAKDLADWLGIGQDGLFNFRPSVRPVPLEVHVGGYPGKHYCPRMCTMNKPCFKGIKQHSPEKPVLIFVSSRRQTRLTALDLVTFLAADHNPKQWLHLEESEIEQLIDNVRDQNLKLTLSFGIGLHHAGLHEKDRKIVEELFVNQKIQVLIATSTLAWGVNFPAHLVIIKGTEYYDGKLRRFVDFPITDVLQMMGRAGRPQFDDHGVALVLVHDIKKQFYKKFVYEPFPVESNLLEVLPDHMNAEIVAGTVSSKQEAIDYMTWTYFFRRLLMNPTYYGLEGTDHEPINSFLSYLIQKCVGELQASSCIDILEDDRTLEPTVNGRIASYYYLSHYTLRMFKERLNEDYDIEGLLKILCEATEYSQLPVRHNEDQLNAELAEKVPIEVDRYTYDSAHTKAHLLLQAHFSRASLPIADYGTDTKSVLDQAIRIMQAMIDFCADEGWLACVLQVVMLMQMVIQGRWYYDCPILQLPKFTEEMLPSLKLSSMRSDGNEIIEDLPTLLLKCKEDGPGYLNRSLKKHLQRQEIEQIWKVLSRLPLISLKTSVHGEWKDGNGRDTETKTIVIDMSDCDRKDIKWIDLHADQEYIMKINLNRTQLNKKKNDSKAFAPLFSKGKDEGWFFILGEVDTHDLLALKRVTFGRRDNIVVSLSFFTPEDCGRKIYTLYIMSDTYQGLDQQYNAHFNVIAPIINQEANNDKSF